VSRDPRYVSFFPGVVAELALPLVSKDRLVGVLNIEAAALEPFTPAARTALQVLASHLAVAIENATLYRETRWYTGLLATLHEIGKETSSILDLDVLLTSGCRASSASRATSSTPSSPRARPGAPAGRPRPTSGPPASWAATSTTSTTWEKACSASRPATSPARAFRPRSTRLEARQGREEYGVERLCRGLEENAKRTATEIGEHLIADLEDFLGKATPHDDVTLIVVKVV